MPQAGLIEYRILMDYVYYALVAVAAYAVCLLVFLAVLWFVPAGIRILWWLLIHPVYSFKAWHSERIPARGGVLLVCNHASYIDWMLVWLACPRAMRIVRSFSARSTACAQRSKALSIRPLASVSSVNICKRGPVPMVSLASVSTMPLA